MGIPEASTFADALDSLGAGLFFLEETSRIVHANASAHAMLRRRSVLRAANDELVACDPGSAQALRKVVSAIARTSAGAQAIAVPLRASDGPHCIAYVLPLALATRRPSGMRYAALLVQKAVLELPSPPDAIARLYGLTPTELRVLLAIVEVGGVREAAASLGVGKATVKTHLHHVFGKTGTTRQADLVKLVAGFANPLVDRSPLLDGPAQHQPLSSPVAAGRLAAQGRARGTRFPRALPAPVGGAGCR